MRAKIVLKYIAILSSFLLIGCSQNGNINTEQDVKQQDNKSEETQKEENEKLENETIEKENTQNDNTENQTTVNDVTGKQSTENEEIESETTVNTTIQNEAENNSNIEAENSTGSDVQDNTNSSNELTSLTSSSTESQETTEDSESMETKIVVYKADRRLELWQNGELAEAFHIGLGKESEGKKEQEGDKKTPEGEYYVCTKNQYSKFYLALGVSYPNIEDAKSGLDNGLIEEDTYNSIETAILNGQCPPWNTALGGEIMIHGHGGSTDWTKGCIGVDDEVMDILWEACSIGTKIIINP